MVLIGTRSELGECLYQSMLKLRYQVFCKRLGWDFPMTSASPILEEDSFDTPTTIYIVIGNPVIACCRLIPSKQNSMISALWPDVSDKVDQNEWELSRFATDKASKQSCLLSAQLLRAAYEYAVFNKIQAYIVITTSPVLRIIQKMGVGIERIESVDTSIAAARADISNETGSALFRLAGHLLPFYPTVNESEYV